MTLPLSILDATQELIFGLDPEGRIAFVNRTGAERLGYSAEELIGQPHDLFHHPLEEPSEACAIRAALIDHRGRRIGSESFFTREGKEVPVEYTVGPRQENGAPAGLVVVARDQVERVKLEERLLIADRLTALGTLASGVAHEINNPLAYVVSNVEFVAEQLRDGEESRPDVRAEILSALEEAKEGSQRISRIVTDLRTFSRTPSEVTAPVDLAEVLRAALQLVRHEIRPRAKLVEDLGAVPPVLASRSSLEQVFVNLLLNAARAIPEGAAATNAISLRCKTTNGQVLVEVEDTGEGMTREVRKHIFDPFFTTRPSGVGSGIGLSLCHAIVSNAGGRIDVHSELGRGSLFRVVLPVARESRART